MKMNAKQLAIYRAGYKKGFERAKALYTHHSPSNDPDARLEQDKQLLTDFLAEHETPVTPEDAALAIGWRIRRTRRAYRALGLLP